MKTSIMPSPYSEALKVSGGVMLAGRPIAVWVVVENIW
jgi:hypothetical protein